MEVENLIEYSTRILVGNVPPVVTLLEANPLRSSFIIGQSIAAGGVWVWPDTNQVANGGIALPSTPPFLTISEEQHGNLVRSSWFISASLPTPVTVFILEGFKTTEYKGVKNATWKQFAEGDDNKRIGGNNTPIGTANRTTTAREQVRQLLDIIRRGCSS